MKNRTFMFVFEYLLDIYDKQGWGEKKYTLSSSFLLRTIWRFPDSWSSSRLPVLAGPFPLLRNLWQAIAVGWTLIFFLIFLFFPFLTAEDIRRLLEMEHWAGQFSW